MGLQAEVAAGNLEVAIDTALGTISCTMDPVVMAGQVLRAAQSLQEATVAAGMCEVICKDIQDTAINRLPVVCELLRLGQLFPEAEGAANLNKAMLQCFKSVCDALHEARTAMYTYLQCNALTRLRQAASVKELMNERRWQLKNRFDDVNTYMSLANLLRSQQSAEQAQHTAAEVRGLQQQVEDLQRVRGADRAQVMALAQACAARQAPKGQKVRVSKSPLNAVAVSPSGEAFATAAADDGAVVTWDTASGTRVRELRRHKAHLAPGRAKQPGGYGTGRPREDRVGRPERRPVAQAGCIGSCTSGPVCRCCLVYALSTCHSVGEAWCGRGDFETLLGMAPGPC